MFVYNKLGKCENYLILLRVTNVDCELQLLATRIYSLRLASFRVFVVLRTQSNFDLQILSCFIAVTYHTLHYFQVFHS
jgi:hypothetical protein